MTTSLFWAFIALLAFVGWATTLIFLMKSLLPMSNAFNVMQKVVRYQDDLVWSMIQRTLRIKENKNVPVQPQRKGQKTEDGTPMDALRNLIGDELLEPIGEQPDDIGVPIEE